MTENEQLAPKEALIKLKEIFPWANYILKNDNGIWVIHEKEPYDLDPYDMYFVSSGRCLELHRDSNIKYEGRWQDSLTGLED